MKIFNFILVSLKCRGQFLASFENRKFSTETQFYFETETEDFIL